MSGLGAIAGATLGIAQAEIDNNRNKNSAKRQYENQRKLNQQGSELALQMWKDTNYSAQRRELNKAGLSTGLMYGMGGGGGATTNAGSGGSAGSQAPSNTDIAENTISGAGMGMQMELMKAQKENIEANTNKTNIEAANTGELGNSKNYADIDNITSDTSGKDIENNVRDMSARDRIEFEKWKTNREMEEFKKSQNEAMFQNETFEDRVERVKLENKAIEIGIKGSEKQIEKASQEILNLKRTLEQTDEKIGIERKEMLIKKLQQEFNTSDANRIKQWVDVGTGIIDGAGNIRTKGAFKELKNKTEKTNEYGQKYDERFDKRKYYR